MKFNKKLVFHLYAFDTLDTLVTYQIHLNCLKRYSNVFDEALFVISVDDVNNINLIKKVELDIFNCGYIKNVTFKVVNNTAFNESATVYDFVTSEIGKYDGLIFFGHTKGLYNEIKAINSPSKLVNKENFFNSIVYWITGMYYFSLEYIFDVESRLISNCDYLSYGPFKCTYEGIDNKYNWIYSGTFFWINPNKIYEFIRQGKIELPKIYNRFYSELLCGNLIDKKYAASYKNLYMEELNSYAESLSAIKFICGGENSDEYKKYIEYHNKMMQD